MADDAKTKIRHLSEAYETGGFRGSGGIFELLSSSGNQTVLTESLRNDFQRFQGLFNSTSLSAEAAAEQLRDVDESIISFAKNTRNGSLTLKDFEAYLKANTVSAKAQSAAIKGASIALNMLAGIAIAAAISAVISGIDNLIHRTEKIKESAAEAQDAIRNAQDTLKTMSDTIAENKDRFLELSEGVDKFSRNVKLSAEDYAEYLSISQKLADIAPSLVIGYDEQGNALLELGSNAEETAKKLDGLLETQQETTRQTLADNLDAVAQGVHVEVKESKGEITRLKQELSDMEKQAQNIDLDIADVVKNGNSIFQFSDANDLMRKQRIAFIDSLEAANIGWESVGNDQILVNDFSSASANGGKDGNEIRDIALQEAQDYYDKQLLLENNAHDASINGLKREIAEKENSLQTSYSKMTANLQAWTKDNYDYQYLSNGFQGIVDALIPNIDWDGLGIDLLSGVDYENYINKHILVPLMNIKPEDKAEINSLFEDLLSFEDGDLDIIPFARKLQERLDEQKIDINISPIIRDEQESYDKLQKSILDISQNGSENYVTASGNKINYEDYHAMQEFTKNFKAEQVELWNAATLGAKNAAEAIEKYNEAGASQLSDTEILSQVQSLSQGLDQLQSIYADISDGGSFDWSSILDNENFHAAFSGMGDAYEDFIKTVSNAPDDLVGCQDAFNELVTDYIHSAKDKNGNSIMGNLTEETKEATIAMLEQMGIANALEIVEQQLAQNTGYLTNAKREQADICKQLSQGIRSEKEEKYLSRLSSLDLANATYAEIQELINEGNTLGLATNALMLFKFYKSQANNESLNTSSDIDNLLSMASAAGIATKSITKLAGLKAAFQNAADNGRKDEALAISKQMEAAANEAQNDILNYKPEAKYNGDSHNNTTPLSTNSSPAETKETFNWLETLLSRLSSAFDKLKQKGEDTFLKFTARADSYKSALENVSQQIAAQQQAYDTYMAHANSVGLPAEYIDKIQNGSISIEEISDDSLKEKIKDYQSWYEKALECGTELEKLKKTQKELAQEKIETLLTQYDKLLSRLEAKNTRTENYIDLKEVWGGSASKNNYKDMNKNILSQISNIIKQNRELKNLQNTVENTSEAWYGYGERMADNNAAIQDLTKNMAENANAAAELARQTAEKRNGKKDTADEITDTKLNTASTAGRKNRLLNSKLGNIDGRQGNLKTAYDTSRKARNSYGNKILKANRKDVSKKNKKYFTKAIASVKSKSLIPASTIDGITNAMKTAEGKEYQELGTLLSYCIYYNANKQAEDENKLNYEMYALTAQAEKKSLREEQLQNNLDKNQSKADRNTMSMANTASAKNHNIDAQTRLNNQNVTSYKNAATKATSDRKKAASKAKFNTDKTYKNLKNKTLKKRLASVISAIKNGKKISGDGLKAVKNYCQKYLNGNMTYYYNCEAYNEAVENELSAKDAMTLAKAEAYAANLQARIEKTENNVSGRDSENELYTAAAKNQTTAKAKNSYVDKQSSNIDKNLNDYKNSYSTLSGEYTSAKQTINKSSSKDKSKQKIITEIKSKYVSKNELIPSNYIEKAYTVSNSFGLACENYNEALEAKNSAQETYELYQQTSQTEKAALALEKMSNIDKEYSNKQSVYEQKATKINHAIDLAQAKGYQVSTTYYSKLIENEESTNQALESKRKELINSLAESMKNGSIVKYSDEWYEACASIDSVTNEIDASTLSLVEFNNQMRQIEWDNFDYLENRIRNVTSEIDFMINELSRKDLASDETGGLTDNGKAVAALHAANYETYQKQAKDYKEKISEINKSLANDPYNKTLLDRKQELIQSYQDSIKAAQDEKDAVIDLNEQGYDALLNKIKNLISEYEELLDAQKDAFDYQNTISDKTKEIANLRKQLTAYAGDTSEEARAKIQSLTVSLEEAERDLQETQYNKYITDTKSMLSDLSDNFEDAIQALIDSLSENFDSLMNDIDSNLSETAETIKEAMTGIGYIPTEEFKTILGSSEIAVSVTKMTGALEQFSLDMQKYSDEIAKSLSDKTASEEESGAEENSTKESGAKESSGTGGSTSNAASTGVKTIPPIASGMEPLNGSATVSIPNNTMPKRRLALKDEVLSYLNTNLEITTKDPRKMSALNHALYNGFGKVLTTAKIKELAKILGVRYDDKKSTGTVYKKLKELGIKGFKTGSWNIPYDQLAFLGEGSYELQFDKSEGVLRKVGQGDIILDANASKNLLQLLNADPEQLIGNINIPVPAPAPNFSSITENRSTGDVKIDMGGIVMNGVNDPKEFTSNLITAINTNAAVKKVMLNHTIGTLSNEYNSLSGRQFTP